MFDGSRRSAGKMKLFQIIITKISGTIFLNICILGLPESTSYITNIKVCDVFQCIIAHCMIINKPER